MRLWRKSLRPAHDTLFDTDAPFLPGCAWRWLTTCFQQATALNGSWASAGGLQMSRPLPPALLQVFSTQLPIPSPPTAQPHRAPCSAFLFPWERSLPGAALRPHPQTPAYKAPPLDISPSGLAVGDFRVLIQNLPWFCFLPWLLPHFPFPK